MEGAYDPDCRRCFDWDKNNCDMELMDAIKGLLALKKNPVLQWGDVSIKEVNGAIRIVRSYEEKNAVLTINSPTAYTIEMDA